MVVDTIGHLRPLRGKGDHRHFRGTQTAYAFSTVEQLMADFWSDVHGLRGDK